MNQDPETRLSQCPDCGEWFDTWKHKPEVRCPACIEERASYLRHYRRNMYAQHEQPKGNER